MSVVVVAPHPDDEVLGCGGVMARYAAAGEKVHVVIVSCGAADLYSDESIGQLRDELRSAHEVLGVSDVKYLDFPAPRLDTVPQQKLADALRDAFQKAAATTLYLPHRADLHTDHRATFLASLVAARPVRGSTVKKILCYETLSETEWAAPFGDEAFTPTHFVDVSDTLQKKLEAMACYHTQLQSPPHPRSLEAVENLARGRGATVGFAAAEAFLLVREIVD